jgi:preprotein translocase subunit SecG
MEIVLRIFQVFLAIGLIGVVLLQRSEGGGLGIGSSGGMGSFMSVRGTANFLTRVTGILAALFMATCLALTLMAKPAQAPRSIFDAPAPAGAPAPAPVVPEPASPPPAADAPATPPPATAAPAPTVAPAPTADPAVPPAAVPGAMPAPAPAPQAVTPAAPSKAAKPPKASAAKPKKAPAAGTAGSSGQ